MGEKWQFVSIFPFSTGTTSRPDLFRPYISCLSFCEFIYALVLLCLEDCFLGVLHSIWLFLPLLPQGFLRPDGVLDLIQIPCLGLSVIKSLTLCMLSGCRSLNMFPFAEGFLTMAKSLGTILLLVPLVEQ